jgi:hypothetical protein
MQQNYHVNANTNSHSRAIIHRAKTSNIAFVSAGHHATERYGVQALCQHLSQKFNLKTKGTRLSACSMVLESLDNVVSISPCQTKVSPIQYCGGILWLIKKYWQAIASSI